MYQQNILSASLGAASINKTQPDIKVLALPQSITAPRKHKQMTTTQAKSLAHFSDVYGTPSQPGSPYKVK
jgi:hypothetical protein